MNAQSSACALLFLALLSLSADARAWCQLRNGRDRSGSVGCEREGRPLAWTRRCLSYSVDVQAGAGFSVDEMRRISAAAFQNWLELPCEDGRPFPFEVREEAPRECNLAQFRHGGPNVNTIAFPERWDFDPRSFAITTVWRNAEGEILDADILVNTRQGPYAECPDDGCRVVDGNTPSDLESVLTHEVGHFFGLAHSQFAFATMHQSAARGEVVKRSVSEDDLDGVCTIYSEDAPACTAESFKPRGGLAEYCEPVDEEGCSANGARPGIGFLIVLLWAMISRGKRSKPQEGLLD